MEDLVAGDLTICVNQDDAAILRLDWLGKSNDRSPSTILAPYFRQLTDLAQSKAQRLELHFEKLEHFNSSTITAIIGLLQELRNKKVGLTLVYDDSLKWQKMSFDALRIFERPDGLLTFVSVDT